MPKIPNIAKLTCAVALLAKQPESAGPRKFEIDPAYGGGKVNLDGWPLPLVIDLATLTVAKRVTANLDHDRKQRVGHAPPEGVVNSGKKITISGLVSGASAAASQFVESGDEGYPWAASIEVAFQQRNVSELAPGKKATMNGRIVEGPCLLGRKGVLFGVAMSDSPADDSTSVTIAATSDKKITLAQMKLLSLRSA